MPKIFKRFNKESRKTVIFGNGLGMALDSEYFLLDSAIQSVWEDDNLIDDVAKQLICSCLPDDVDSHPRGEEDMDKLQLALASCDYLNGIQSEQYHWLTEHGKSFPKAVRSFIYNTSIHFHNPKEYLPESFLNPLIEFVTQTQSHVATLNYDNLIYRPFIENDVLSGYDGALIDGFWGNGFDGANLARHSGRTFGYYLHLHGSPLYVNRDERVIKLSQSGVSQGSDLLSSHIVLTHVEHKKTIIEKSKVLSTYWNYLRKAIQESSEVLLVGYSGLDIHLNELISSLCETKNIRVVEWSGSDGIDNRQEFWNEQFGKEVELFHFNNILEFKEW